MISTDDAVRDYLVGTRNHSYSYEYFRRELGIESRDANKPHDDGGGADSKFNPDMAEHLSMDYIVPKISAEVVRDEVMPFVEKHREQFHHWILCNYSNGLATLDDFMCGALDTVLSILEKRPYQGGADSIEEIEENPYRFVNGSLCYHKVPWVLAVAKMMKKVEQLPSGINPTLDRFDDVANLGEMYHLLAKETDITRAILRSRERGYNI